MKKTLLLIFSAICFNQTISAQSIETANVPAPVTTAFNTTFSNMENVKWEMDYDNYIAKFKKSKIETAVTYDKDGKWISTETPITHSNVPKAVRAALDKEFDAYKENEIEKVENREGVFYNFELEYKQMNYVVVISKKGELISSEEVKEIKKDN